MAKVIRTGSVPASDPMFSKGLLIVSSPASQPPKSGPGESSDGDYPMQPVADGMEEWLQKELAAAKPSATAQGDQTQPDQPERSPILDPRCPFISRLHPQPSPDEVDQLVESLGEDILESVSMTRKAITLMRGGWNGYMAAYQGDLDEPETPASAPTVAKPE